MSEAVSEAAARLERAVDRLAQAMAQPRPEQGIPPDQVASLASRLDNTLARLRGALAELEGGDAVPHAVEQAAGMPPAQASGPDDADAIAPAPPMQDEER
ncbi:hypothetical protein IBL26_24075 [Roseomonas aerophila]|uniref:Uncharacterized protein n=1 Tax=Teichococcus aerophilus TaxID=1224513 RepID=A0ABR7RUQ0_9PROT|nr:hypothetical protein [Pseudoroseomonas aerophila]MBC9209934.1 hypothetical protein [Pseudoroseomonas aerophila]